jgi:hypothetical protein
MGAADATCRRVGRFKVDFEKLFQPPEERLALPRLFSFSLSFPLVRPEHVALPNDATSTARVVPSLGRSSCGPEVTVIAWLAGLPRRTPVCPSELECLVLRHRVEHLTTSADPAANQVSGSKCVRPRARLYPPGRAPRLR